MSDNTVFLQLAKMLPTLQHIISNNEPHVECPELNAMTNDVKEVCKTSFKIYRSVLQMQASLPAQVEDQKPVYFMDACAFQARIDLTWINSWEAFLAVLAVRFKQRGLRIVEKRQYVLEDAHSKVLVDSTHPFELYFIPGRKINMDALFVEKEHTRNCCPSCQYQEPTADIDQAIDCSQCGIHYQRIEEKEVAEAGIGDIDLPTVASRERKANNHNMDIASTTEDDSPNDHYSHFRRLHLRTTRVKPSDNVFQWANHGRGLPAFCIQILLQKQTELIHLEDQFRRIERHNRQSREDNKPDKLTKKIEQKCIEHWGYLTAFTADSNQELE
ncbi:hypothetical protein NA57DRAFT_81353 [Rhizodiscina lignyota]|uniref:Ubiquitin-like domain-containing protein n=1 Tax=Rhizodiscina lignyota TaxID=1504668 RepID=A0A9P4I1U1_9PEZI|nr:hypothetical protein NA57DRAFT_81353 [Rhizodiscina lignyota]